jgi:cytochrome c oxidase cbb3-type subunit 1
MALSHAQAKYMTFGEGGSALAFAGLAIFSIVIAAKAYTPEYAFHAYLFAAGSVAAVFAIANRYFDRGAQAAPGESGEKVMRR